MSSDSSDLLTLKEAAEQLNCHPNTLRHWDNDGTLKAVRFGKRGDRRYLKSDIQNVIANQNKSNAGATKDTKNKQDHLGLIHTLKESFLESSQMEKALRALYASAYNFLDPRSLEETYKNIIAEAIKLVDGQYGSIFFLNKVDFVRVYTNYPKLQHIVPRPGGTIHKSFYSRDPIVTYIEDAHPQLKDFGIKSVVTIPLVYAQKSVGVLSLLSTSSKEFSANELHLLRIFGLLSSIAIIKSQQYDDLKKSLELRDLFISITSHEIKTPLTVIHTYTELINNKLAKGEQPKPEWGEKLLEETKRFNRLITDYFKKEDTIKLNYEFQECSLLEILDNTIRNSHMFHPDHTYKFRNNLRKKSDQLFADCDKLTQVFTNLVNNAAKYSPQGSAVTISVSFKKEQFIIKVIDKGIGIDAADIPFVFDRFFQGKEKKEGMGLGLFLAKTIVESHKGTITISSEKGKGTVVEVQLPAHTYATG